jgi:hypothetical protein
MEALTMQNTSDKTWADAAMDAVVGARAEGNEQAAGVTRKYALACGELIRNGFVMKGQTFDDDAGYSLTIWSDGNRTIMLQTFMEDGDSIYWRGNETLKEALAK